MRKGSIPVLLVTLLLCVCISNIALAATYYIECPANAKSGWYWPVSASKHLTRGYKTKDYGDSPKHLGIDISASSGSEVRAAKAGKVVLCFKGCKNVNAADTKKSCTKAGCNPNDGNTYMSNYGITVCNHGYGNGVVIDHQDGTFSHYAHLRDNPLVSWGQTVTQGQLLGYVGSSGCSSGPHLHFAISADEWNNTSYNCNPNSDSLKITVSNGANGNPNWSTDKANLYDKHGVSYITTLAKQDFDVNAMLDNTLMSNLGDCGTFDIYIDGKLIQSGVTDFNGSYTPGTKYKIVAHANPGYIYYGAEKQYWADYVSGPVEGEILTHTTKVCLGFKTDPNMIFSISGQLDGYDTNDLSGYATFDVWINNQEVAHKVSQYSGTHQINQSYSIKNIQPANGKTYIGTINAGETGTLQRGLGFVTLVINTDGIPTNEWQYCYNLPPFTDQSIVEVEYRQTLETQATLSPGDGWSKGDLVSCEYINDGSTYTSDFELTTSETRALISYYYYHWCSKSDDNANYEPTSKYVHYDQINNPSLVTVANTQKDSIDNRYIIYNLKWASDGNWAYCQSGVTCDGKSGSHGKRSYHWYKRYVYQNKKAVYTYKWIKDSGWQSYQDQAVSPTGYRFRMRIPQINWALELPSGLIIIDSSAFSNDISVSTVKLGNSVKEIRSGAFSGCSELTFVYIPDSVITIAKDAFDKLDGLTLICATDNAGAAFARNMNIHYLIEQRTEE